MKMGKKVREYKAGDFIFAKVKGYPAWPARVQRMNGKKYFVYFYGTGEIANLPPNMIFDYAENKDKFLTKTVKRRDFNEGVKQIEYDFANNVPLEEVIGVAPQAEVPEANVTANESAVNETLDDTMADTTAADETMADETTQNDTGIEDSDDTGALVIDEGKQAKAGRKSTAKTPAKETPKAKEPKTPRSRAKKEDDAKEDVKEEKEEELVSRSGRKIRPKRYIDEHTEENTTLPSPAPKKRRGASPVEKDKEKESKEKESKDKDKNIKYFNAVTRAEIEDMKEPLTIAEDPEKENIIIAYIPSGQYIGVKLFQSKPTSFKNERAKLQWQKQAATNALTLKSQLEKGHITPQSVLAQLVMDLNLTDEEKATLDKDRETEEKKSHVQYLKVEMKLMQLDTKIKTCLCLEKADTELCLKFLDELMELDIKPLMLLKHPTSLETIKRMRAYVGNTPSWELSESEAMQFHQQALKIRKKAETVYNNMKKLFPTPEGLTFWEFFTARVEQFKKATEKLTPEELLEIAHEPLEMTVPTAHTMKAAIETANEEEKKEKEPAEETEKTKEPDEEAKKNKSTSAKAKKSVNNNTSSKTPAKRQSSRNKAEDKDKEDVSTPATEDNTNIDKSPDTEQKQEEQQQKKDESKTSQENDPEDKEVSKEKDKRNPKESKVVKEEDKGKESTDSTEKDKVTKDNNSKDKTDPEEKGNDKEKTPEKSQDSIEDIKKEGSFEEEKKESSKEIEKEKTMEKSDKDDKKEEKDKTEDEPRSKRSRESKKTDPPPRSPNKRKTKF